MDMQKYTQWFIFIEMRIQFVSCVILYSSIKGVSYKARSKIDFELFYVQFGVSWQFDMIRIFEPVWKIDSGDNRSVTDSQAQNYVTKNPKSRKLISIETCGFYGF